MNKELEKDLEVLVDYAKEGRKFIDISVIAGCVSNIKSAFDYQEKLEKVWAIFNTNHITYEHKELIKKANNYKEYVDLYRFSFRITDLHEHLVEEDEFKLLKEMIK